MADKSDLILQDPAGNAQLVDPAVQAELMRSLVQLMRGMSDMVAATNASMEAIQHRLDAMERRQHLMERVTPGQAKAINAALKKQAQLMCSLYGLPEGAEKKLIAAIRTDVCNSAGVRTVRDLPACDYDVHLQLIDLWEEYEKIQAIKAKL